MPTVIQSLCEPDFTFLDFKLEILLSHKDDAKAAVPVLLNLLTNAATMGSPTNAVVRDQVRAALRQLDPDAAARAGVE
jgi:hypothetical protein